MTQTLERIMAETSRAAEYFSVRELQAQTGQPEERLSSVVLKELVDNSLDAAESAGVAPEVEIGVEEREETVLTVRDNGLGIKPETMERILDFNVRVSDKSIYRSPTRGAQGNALKTVLGIPYALGSEDPVIIESQGVRHVISARIDPAGNVLVDHGKESSGDGTGTRIALSLPSEGQRFAPGYWAEAFAALNPHVVVRIRDSKSGINQDKSTRSSNSREIYHPTADFPGGWRKFLPTDLTSSWWYDSEALKRLIFSHIALVRNGHRDLPLREFVRQFRGLTAHAKAKAVCGRFPDITRLRDFEDRPELASDLLDVMKEYSKAPSQAVLGCVGAAHFQTHFERYGLLPDRFWYKKVTGGVDSIPFVAEVAVGETTQGELFHGVNFSPTFDDPLSGTPLDSPESTTYGLRGFLASVYCDPFPKWKEQGHTVAVAFHLVCPALQFMDRGKTRLRIPTAMADEITRALRSATKTLYKGEKRRRKDAARQEQARREPTSQRQADLNEAVFAVVPEAMAHASGKGAYPVSARNLWYAVRPLVKRYTARNLTYEYFGQILVQYRERYGPIEGLYHDPRGVLYEPHTGEAVPVGTREVESYSFPDWVFNKILYVEKKGLWPILEAAKLAERYDMAVIAAEGYATQAARALFERGDKHEEYQLFVLHDSDPFGYDIARTLRESTRRMPEYQVDVIDLGLTLAEALEMGLKTEEFTRRKALPQALQLSELEKEYFTGRRVGKNSWIARRVELNAMTAPQLVGHIEHKLRDPDATGKVLPPEDIVRSELEQQYRRDLEALAKKRIVSLLDVPAMVQKAVEHADKLDLYPDDVAQKLVGNPPVSWRELVGKAAVDAARRSMKNVPWDKVLGR